jgi:hypothetical protein
MLLSDIDANYIARGQTPIGSDVWNSYYTLRAMSEEDTHEKMILGKALAWVNAGLADDVGVLLTYGPSALKTLWDGQPFPPIIYDATGQLGILAGYHRFIASKILQLQSIPTRMIPQDVWYTAGLVYVDAFHQGGATAYPIV